MTYNTYLSLYSSRISLASGLNSVSILVLKNIFNLALNILLNIFNSLWTNCIIQESWKWFHVILIPKPNLSPIAYKLIVLSSVFCKFIESMIKNRLGWFLEKNRLLPNNIHGFRRSIGTIECLSLLIGPIYQTFCNKEFFSVAFHIKVSYHIKEAFDSVYIPTLIS